MKVKEKFKVKEVREVESLLTSNPDLSDDEITAKTISILCNEKVTAKQIPEMDEVDVLEIISDYWLYKKKLNENIAQKLTGSPVERT